MKRSLALVVAATAVLAGCATAAPAETVTVTVAPEPEPTTPEPTPEPTTVAPTPEPTTADFDRMMLEIVWAASDPQDQFNICNGIHLLSRSWFYDTWDADQAGVSAATAYDFFVEVC